MTQSASEACRREGPETKDEGQSDDQQDEEEEDLPYPGFAPKAFYFLEQTDRPRNWCLRLITWPWFERISMSVILLNCITLGMFRPCEDSICETTRCKVLANFDHFIFAFFAIEMILKVTAMGLIGKKTYLSETWNRLDMFIVLAGAVEYAADTENLSLSAIRTIRVLRPLRAINRIPSLRILVMLLLDTLPMLGNVLLLCFFVFFIFGIIGVQLWAGLLRNRCFIDRDLLENVSFELMNLSNHYIENSRDYICSSEDNAGMSHCDSLPPFEWQERTCNASALPFSDNTPSNESCVNWNQYYTKCQAGVSNPFQGAISFDNIGLAWVAIFQVISLAGWVNIMYFVQDAHSFWDWIYFVALIVIGAFFMINLCLVVIATQFSETKKRETERMKLERKRFHSSSTLASNSEPGGCYEEIMKYLAHMYRHFKRKFNRKFRQAKSNRHRKVTPEKAISLRRKRQKLRVPQTLHFQILPHHSPVFVNSDSPTAPRASPEASDIDPLSSPRRPNLLFVPRDSIVGSTISSDTLQGLVASTPHASRRRLSFQSSPVRQAISRTSSFNSYTSANSANASIPLSEVVVEDKADNNGTKQPLDTSLLQPNDASQEKRLSIQLSCTFSDDAVYHCMQLDPDWSDDTDSSSDWDDPPKKKKVPTATLR